MAPPTSRTRPATTDPAFWTAVIVDLITGNPASLVRNAARALKTQESNVYAELTQLYVEAFN